MSTPALLREHAETRGKEARVARVLRAARRFIREIFMRDIFPFAKYSNLTMGA
jgi:hypothetical protein